MKKKKAIFQSEIEKVLGATVGVGSLQLQLIYLIAAVLLLIWAGQAIWAAAQDSLTVDEPAHIAAGYLYVAEHDLSIHPINPPIVRYLIGIPLVWRYHSVLSQQDWSDEFKHDPFGLGQAIVYGYGLNADEVIFWARLPVIVLGILLGGLVFIWSRQLFGAKAAVLALTLYALEPNLLAHGHLATIDLGFTFFFMLTLYLFWRFLRSPRLSLVTLSAVGFGITLGAKLSALTFLLPAIVILWFLFLQLDKKITSRRKLYWLVIYLFVSALTLWAAYLFSTDSIVKAVGSEGTFLGFLKHHLPTEFQPLAPLINGIATHIFFPPKQYLLGLWDLYQHNQRGAWAYFFGSSTGPGAWYFFPIITLIKLPIGLLFFLMVGFYLLYRQKATWVDWAVLLLPLGSIYFFAMLSNYHFGLRHILPVIPLFIIVASQSALVFWSDLRYRFSLIFGSLMLAWYIVSPLFASPHYLTYFNESVGGPKQGYHIRRDADGDWGQGIKYLKKYLDQQGVDSVILKYYGSSKPAYYGITYQPYQEGMALKGWVAIAATSFTPDLEEQLAPYVPKVVVANSILVYYLE